VIARAGLWGNHGYEADYEFAWEDENGEDLDGSRSYELTLSPPPPVDAFWSLTMYDIPDFYLVANPIDRYSIGDRTPGLKYGDDGSVTLYPRSGLPRRRQGIELAARAPRAVPARHAHVPAAPRDPRRGLHPAGDQATLIALVQVVAGRPVLRALVWVPFTTLRHI
jgi:hypothetical protein